MASTVLIWNDRWPDVAAVAPAGSQVLALLWQGRQKTLPNFPFMRPTAIMGDEGLGHILVIPSRGSKVRTLECRTPRPGLNAYRFSFQGQEQDDELHGAVGTSYSFSARLYDPRIGRWNSIDPLASMYPFSSPYVFVLNTPLQAIDPDGERVRFKNRKDAGRIAQDLNRIYKTKYGVEDAFLVSMRVVQVQRRTNAITWNPTSWFATPEYETVEVEEYYLETNMNAMDWNTDRYTQGMHDMVNTSVVYNARIEGQGEGGGQDGDYGFFVTEDLKEYGDKGTTGKYIIHGEGGHFSLGLVFMHELLFHKHPLGTGEWQPDLETGLKGPDKMRRYYSGASGNDSWGPKWHKSSEHVLEVLKHEMPELREEREDAAADRTEGQ